MGNKLSSTRNNRFNATDLESGSSSSGGKVGVVRPLWMRVLHRVPQGLREKSKHLYEPAVMSLGPYHHGRPQLRQLEAFKETVEKLTLQDEGRRLRFRRKIVERMDDIRHFYGGLSRDEFDDDMLADMMLRDACTLLYLLDINAMKEDIEESAMLAYHSLGFFQLFQAIGDMIKLENQIPWWLMNSLISLTYGDGDGDDDDDKKGKEFIRRLFSFQVFKNPTDLKQIPWHQSKDEYNPLHLLEAHRSTTIIALDKSRRDVRRSSSLGIHGKRSFRSVSELKAKGIYFKPTSRFVNDISFTSYSVFGVLHLPILTVYRRSEVFFSNLIALEMSPGPLCFDSISTSYLTFMKSMIQSVEDVKLGMAFLPIFDEIKIRINQHCDSKAKTWIADLFNTNFSSPWTFVAFLAAALLLCLTFLQTYYTVNPV